MTKILEIVRWLGVSLAIFLALAFGADPMDRLAIYAVVTAVFLLGLTGLESLFWGAQAAQESGYGAGGRGYQRQSALNNLAVAITAVLAYVAGWGPHAYLTIMTIVLVFLTLSAANHAWSAITEGNRSWRNLLRPGLVVLLWAVSLPFILHALHA